MIRLNPEFEDGYNNDLELKRGKDLYDRSKDILDFKNVVSFSSGDDETVLYVMGFEGDELIIEDREKNQTYTITNEGRIFTNNKDNTISLSQEIEAILDRVMSLKKTS